VAKRCRTSRMTKTLLVAESGRERENGEDSAKKMKWLGQEIEKSIYPRAIISKNEMCKRKTTNEIISVGAQLCRRTGSSPEE